LIQKGSNGFYCRNVKELNDWGKGKPVLMGRKEDEDFFFSET
jgi:hypothetical protein